MHRLGHFLLTWSLRSTRAALQFPEKKVQQIQTKGTECNTKKNETEAAMWLRIATLQDELFKYITSIRKKYTIFNNFKK